MKKKKVVKKKKAKAVKSPFLEKGEDARLMFKKVSSEKILDFIKKETGCELIIVLTSPGVFPCNHEKAGACDGHDKMEMMTEGVDAGFLPLILTQAIAQLPDAQKFGWDKEDKKDE